MNKLTQELRDQSVDDLSATLYETSKELFNLRNELSVNKKLDKPHLSKRFVKSVQEC